MEKEINVRHITWFILACLLVLIPGLFVDVMNIDAAQYASISREMLETGKYLEVHHHYTDYLDKPPLLFWLSAASFKVFGVSNFAYKFPSFLFAIVGIFSTMKLGALLYDRKTGAVAGLMLAFSLAMFVMTNDIRTDTILLGTTIFATWQLLLFIKTKRWSNLLLGFVGIGLAMLAKGPLGFILPAAALSCEFMYKRQWKNFVRWEWLIGLFVVGILLFPMCYGLYHQFDLHPEKNINGSTGVSGLRFYFWTQSFGRITGESDWGTKFDNGAGPFFFTHTFMWTFFPWSLLIVGALLKNIFVLIRSRFKAGFMPELLSTGGFILVFVALSASRYKLPHYVYVLLPLAAIISARFFVEDVLNPAKKYLFRIFSVLHWMFFGAAIFICYYALVKSFPGATFPVYLVIIGFFILAVKSRTPFEKLTYPMLAAMLAFYFLGTTHFYPKLLMYQSGVPVGRLVAEMKIPNDDFYTLILSDHALDFYSRRAVPSISMDDSQTIDRVISKYGKLWVYTDEEGYAMVKASPYKIISQKEFEHFRVQFLTINFIRPEKRKETLSTKYFLEIAKE